MQCWDITFEAVSFRNDAASRRVRERDTSCCLHAGTLPALWVSVPYPVQWLQGLRKHEQDEHARVSVSQLQVSTPGAEAKFLRRYCESCIRSSVWWLCFTEKTKQHLPSEVPKEYCSKFRGAAGTFPHLIWLLSPVEGELELFWIILCQISRLTKWIWLTYEKWINPRFISNGSLSPEMIVNSTYFGLEHLQQRWKQFLKH